MSLLFPNYKAEYSKKNTAVHWAKVALLIGITALLTWYGKFYKPEPTKTYINDFAVWILPHKNGLGALIALPNDNSDSTNEKTGLRIWVQPPDSILAFENTGVRYRGKNIVVVGDSLGDSLKRDMLSTLDSNGNFFWLSGLGTEYTGEDVFAELKLFNDKPQDYLLDIIYEGCKLRFFGSQTAVDSAGNEPLSAALLMFKTANESEPPFKNDEQVQALIWNGKSSGENQTRIALNYFEAYALVSFNQYLGLRVQRMHLKDWNPEL